MSFLSVEGEAVPSGNIFRKNLGRIYVHDKWEGKILEEKRPNDCTKTSTTLHQQKSALLVALLLEFSRVCRDYCHLIRGLFELFSRVLTRGRPSTSADVLIVFPASFCVVSLSLNQHRVWRAVDWGQEVATCSQLLLVFCPSENWAFCSSSSHQIERERVVPSDDYPFSPRLGILTSYTPPVLILPISPIHFALAFLFVSYLPPSSPFQKISSRTPLNSLFVTCLRMTSGTFV